MAPRFCISIINTIKYRKKEKKARQHHTTTIEDIDRAKRLESSSSGGMVSVDQFPHTSVHDIGGLDNHGDAQNHISNHHIDVDDDPVPGVVRT